MSNITNDRMGYEGMCGLGDPSYTDLTSWIQADAPILGPVYASTSIPNISAPTTGFDWTSLIMPLEKTGLQIASNVTNPAYNTPGSYTRLADGTVIATAGTAATNYGSISPTSFTSILGSGGSSMLPLLLIGGVILLFVSIGGKH